MLLNELRSYFKYIHSLQTLNIFQKRSTYLKELLQIDYFTPEHIYFIKQMHLFSFSKLAFAFGIRKIIKLKSHTIINVNFRSENHTT